MDDDDDLPDDTGKATSGLISDLFGDTKRKPDRRTNLDDILGGGGSRGAKRKPTVTFQEPTATRTTTSSKENVVPTLEANPNLFSSLFTSTEQSRRRPATFEDKPSTTTSGKDFVDSRISSRGREKTEQVEQRYTTKSSDAEKDLEIEKLRREISSLRYEKNEDQLTISELRRKNDNMVEEHKKNIQDVEEKNRREIEELKRVHVRELEATSYTKKQDVEVISLLERQSSYFDIFQSKIESINSILGELHQEIRSVNTEHGNVDQVIKYANEQISHTLQKIQEEKDNWENKKSDQVLSIEKNIESLYQQYTAEILQGRRWLESEKTEFMSEKLAFQEEQSYILQFLDQKRQEMEELKSDFITKEHDLLVRVVNERNILDQMKNEFLIQRNADIIRIRDEAEHLERCLIQVENAYQGLEKARIDYEQKIMQI
uniref:Uncharacterized protein n=1 Tax=Acrobeloides nanus TaxID=290746 RepID=A0A914C5P2_9BILA